jgi:hypothetical protein
MYHGKGSFVANRAERYRSGMKLYCWRYRPHARNAPVLLDRIPASYELNEVQYGTRQDLARLERPIRVEERRFGAANP